MTYKCSVCGIEFDDGDELAQHIEETHEERTVGVAVEETIETEDRFG